MDKTAEVPADPRQMYRDRRLQKPKEMVVVASVLLTRPPLLLPDLHPFEQVIRQYLEMIERHQYSDFPIHFYFKKGSVGEKRWKQQNSREPRKSGSGILRPFPDDEDKTEWILGGVSDQQVMRVRRHAPKIAPSDRPEKNEDPMTEEEKRDLDQFAQSEELENATTEIPAQVNSDFHRLEREPKRTLYCLVKRSKEYNEQTGRAQRDFGLIGAPTIGKITATEHEPLHHVRFYYST